MPKVLFKVQINIISANQFASSTDSSKISDIIIKYDLLQKEVVVICHNIIVINVFKVLA